MDARETVAGNDGEDPTGSKPYLAPATPPPPGHGTIVFFTVTDDERQGDGDAVMIDGFFNGETVEQDILALEARGVRIPWYFCTRGLCEPTRAELMSAMSRINHGAENFAADRYNIWQHGVFDNRTIGSGTQFEGPYYFDLALQAGLAETPVPAADQPFVGQITTHNFNRPPIPAWANNFTSGTFPGGYPRSQLVTFGSQTYISLQDNNLGHQPDISPLWWATSTATTGRGNIDPAIDDLQYTTGSIFTRLPDNMTGRDAARPHIHKAWVGKGDTYDGDTSINAADPLYDLWSAATIYTIGQGVHDGSYFYTSRINGNVNQPPTSGATDANWQLAGGTAATSVPQTTRFCCAGVNFFAVLNGDGLGEDGSTVDYYHNEYVYYNAAEMPYTNARDRATSVVGDLHAYDYDYAISTITWDATNKRALVTLSTPTGWTRNGVFISTPLSIGDEVGINGTNNVYKTHTGSMVAGTRLVTDSTVTLDDLGKKVSATHITNNTTNALDCFIASVNPGVNYTLSQPCGGTATQIANGTVFNETVSFWAYDSRGWIVDDVLSATQFYIKHDFVGSAISNGGTWTSAGATAFPRKYYTAQLDKMYLNRFLDTLNVADHAYIHYCPRMPHGETNTTEPNDPNGDFAFELERRYYETVDPAAAMMYGSLPGVYSPANIDATAVADGQAPHWRVWRQRKELVRAWNDLMCRDADAIVPRLDRTYGTTGWKWIRASDNGWNNGAHEASESATWAWSTIGAKELCWVESINVPFFIMNASWSDLVPGTTRWDIGPFMPCDIQPTIFDIYYEETGDTIFRDHALHLKADGQSIRRWLDATEADDIRKRLIPFQGKYLVGAWSLGTQTNDHGGIGVMDRRGNRLFERFDDDAAGTGNGNTKTVPQAPAGFPHSSFGRYNVTIPQWDAATTYAWRTVARVGDIVWISLQNGNVNHAPGSSPTWWSLAPYEVTLPEITNLITGSPGNWDAITTDMDLALKDRFNFGRWNGTVNRMRTPYTGS